MKGHNNISERSHYKTWIIQENSGLSKKNSRIIPKIQIFKKKILLLGMNSLVLMVVATQLWQLLPQQHPKTKPKSILAKLDEIRPQERAQAGPWWPLRPSEAVQGTFIITVQLARIIAIQETTLLLAYHSSINRQITKISIRYYWRNL